MLVVVCQRFSCVFIVHHRVNVFHLSVHLTDPHEFIVYDEFVIFTEVTHHFSGDQNSTKVYPQT